MESTHPTRRRNLKHWQARLSCTNCLSQRTADCPEVELKSFIEGAIAQNQLKPDCIPEEKADKNIGVKLENKPEETAEKQIEAKVEKRNKRTVTKSETKTDAKSDLCFPDKKEEITMKDKDKGKKKAKPEKAPKEGKDVKLEKKASGKSKESKGKDKDKDKKKQSEKHFEPRKMKNNNPTFTQIGSSVNHNCCSCLDALQSYFKEFFRFSCSLTTGHPAQDTQFQERICDMLNIMATMLRDCWYIVRYVLRILFVE